MSLVLTFTMCRDQDYCKTEKEIKSWMARKFFLVMENTIAFDRQTVENSGLKKESRLVCNVVSPQLRTDYVTTIEVT